MPALKGGKAVRAVLFTVAGRQRCSDSLRLKSLSGFYERDAGGLCHGTSSRLHKLVKCRTKWYLISNHISMYRTCDTLCAPTQRSDFTTATDLQTISTSVSQAQPRAKLCLSCPVRLSTYCPRTKSVGLHSMFPQFSRQATAGMRRTACAVQAQCCRTAASQN